MTIAELIEELRKYDPKTEAVMPSFGEHSSPEYRCDEERGNFCPVAHIIQITLIRPDPITVMEVFQAISINF